MINVKTDPSLFLLPPNTRESTYESADPDVFPLPSLVTPSGVVVSQWKPDANDLILLNAGVAVTLAVYTFNQPLQPVCVAVGGLDLRNE